MKIRFDGSFDGCSVKGDGTVSMTFKVPFSGLSESMKSVMLIDRVIAAGFVVNDKPLKIGKATFGQLTIDREGESKVRIDSSLELLTLTLEELQSVVKAPVAVVLAVKGEDGE